MGTRTELPVDGTREDLNSRGTREDWRSLIERAFDKWSNNPVCSETAMTGTDIHVSEVKDPGFVLTGYGSNRVLSHVLITATYATFKGVHFTDILSKDAQALVTVGATSLVKFVDCIFSRNTVGDFIAMTAGARCIFNACTFDGTVGAGTLINNAGLATAATLVGCMNAVGLVVGANTTDFGSL